MDIRLSILFADTPRGKIYCVAGALTGLEPDEVARPHVGNLGGTWGELGESRR
jgi:hypothetical protein